MATELVVRKKFNFLERLSQVYALYIIAIFPLLVDKTGYSAITQFKFKAFWISAVIYFAISLGVVIYYLVDKEKIMAQRKKELVLKLTIPQILALAYIVWCAISSLLSKYGKETWIGMGRFEGLFSVILYSMVFVLVSFWGEYTVWYKRGFVVFALVFSFIGTLQLFYEGIIHPEGYSYWGVSFMGTIGNIDCVGGYAAMVIPVLFGSYVFTEDKKWNIAGLVGMAALNFLFTITDVDSGKIGLILAFVIAFPFLFDSKKNTYRTFLALAVFAFSMFFAKFLGLSKQGAHITFGTKTAVLLFGSIICLGLSWFVKNTKFKLKISQDLLREIILYTILAIFVIVFLFVFFYQGNIRLVKEASEMLHGELADTAGTGRGYIWKTSWWLAKQGPLFGYGPGTFVAEYYPYDILETTTDFAHNDFLQIAVCVGIGGMILYSAYCVMLAARALKRAYKCPLIVIFGAGCAGYLAHSFFSFSIAIVTPMFWVMAGIMDKLVRQFDATEQGQALISAKKNARKAHKQ